MKTKAMAAALWIVCVFSGAQAKDAKTAKKFDPQNDLVSLHYDHAADKDDGQSAAADRTILESLYGRKWLAGHVAVVSGAYGKNGKTFNPQSDKVMDAVWKDTTGWLSGHKHREQTIADLGKRWRETLENGGDVWVKEGGQSDITAAVVKGLKASAPEVDTRSRIHVVQHSKWNERQTDDDALAYTKNETDYIRIPDANRYLNVKGGNARFQAAALAHPVFGPSWRAAFDYYDPGQRLDFSDTGELMRILGLGEVGIDAFTSRFLEGGGKKTPANAPQPNPRPAGG